MRLSVLLSLKMNCSMWLRLNGKGTEEAVATVKKVELTLLEKACTIFAAM